MTLPRPHMSPLLDPTLVQDWGGPKTKPSLKASGAAGALTAAKTAVKGVGGVCGGGGIDRGGLCREGGLLGGSHTRGIAALPPPPLPP